MKTKTTLLTLSLFIFCFGNLAAQELYSIVEKMPLYKDFTDPNESLIKAAEDIAALFAENEIKGYGYGTLVRIVIDKTGAVSKVTDIKYKPFWVADPRAAELILNMKGWTAGEQQKKKVDTELMLKIPGKK